MSCCELFPSRVGSLLKARENWGCFPRESLRVSAFIYPSISETHNFDKFSQFSSTVQTVKLKHLLPILGSLEQQVDAPFYSHFNCNHSPDMRKYSWEALVYREIGKLSSEGIFCLPEMTKEKERNELKFSMKSS